MERESRDGEHREALFQDRQSDRKPEAPRGTSGRPPPSSPSAATPGCSGRSRDRDRDPVPDAAAGAVRDHGRQEHPAQYGGRTAGRVRVADLLTAGSGAPYTVEPP
ncbi:hypothetical protein GCM10010406_13610 [Streptomyces thermolineatus]|uniref:Uncharacterized protein n=1 Tax=Streptomyces thermolineatus TaxID=44033 RepID=A0ABP5YGR5_9ACTN